MSCELPPRPAYIKDNGAVWTWESISKEIAVYDGHLKMALETGMTAHAEAYARHLDSLQRVRMRFMVGR